MVFVILFFCSVLWRFFFLSSFFMEGRGGGMYESEQFDFKNRRNTHVTSATPQPRG